MINNELRKTKIREAKTMDTIIGGSSHTLIFYVYKYMLLHYGF